MLDSEEKAIMVVICVLGIFVSFASRDSDDDRGGCECCLFVALLFILLGGCGCILIWQNILKWKTTTNRAALDFITGNRQSLPTTNSFAWIAELALPSRDFHELDL